MAKLSNSPDRSGSRGGRHWLRQVPLLGSMENLLFPSFPLSSLHLSNPGCRHQGVTLTGDCQNQRWAPGAYNPRALGVSLGISGHRTDLVQEIPEPDRDRAHTERELTYAGSRTDRVGNLTERIGSTVSNTRPRSSGNRSESQPDVCNVISAN